MPMKESFNFQKILNKTQIKEADEHCIKQEGISSIDLMERAAKVCTDYILRNYPKPNKCYVLCGPGNNGGDGLAITRLLIDNHWNANAIVLKTNGSEDFNKNLQKLNTYTSIENDDELPFLSPNTLVIDALFGSGLNRPLEGTPKKIVEKINASSSTVLSIDLPSGMYTDKPNGKNVAIKNAHVLTFQRPKLTFFMSESSAFVRSFKVLNIGLSESFIQKQDSAYHYVTSVDGLKKPRPKFSYKSTFGHGLLISGKKGMIGATQLAAKAVLKAGAGKLTVHTASSANDILQISVPEALVNTDLAQDYCSTFPSLEPFTAIGIGPGLGMHTATVNMLQTLLKQNKKPMLIDADALNIIGNNPEFLDDIPMGSVLTPHLGEFQKLTGKVNATPDAHTKMKALAKRTQSVIVLKGAYTTICSPDGNFYINSTGNPALAKGGSGDVLSGLILGLLCRGYTALEASLIAVYTHGATADEWAEKNGQESLLASDLLHLLKI